MAIRKRRAFLFHNKTNDHYANYSLHILIFPQILGKFLYMNLRSVTQTTYFSSGLEHRLYDRKLNLLSLRGIQTTRKNIETKMYEGAPQVRLG